MISLDWSLTGFEQWFSSQFPLINMTILDKMALVAQNTSVAALAFRSFWFLSQSLELLSAKMSDKTTETQLSSEVRRRSTSSESSRDAVMADDSEKGYRMPKDRQEHAFLQNILNAASNHDADHMKKILMKNKGRKTWA